MQEYRGFPLFRQSKHGRQRPLTRRLQPTSCALFPHEDRQHRPALERPRSMWAYSAPRFSERRSNGCFDTARECLASPQTYQQMTSQLAYSPTHLLCMPRMHPFYATARSKQQPMRPNCEKCQRICRNGRNIECTREKTPRKRLRYNRRSTAPVRIESP